MTFYSYSIKKIHFVLFFLFVILSFWYLFGGYKEHVFFVDEYWFIKRSFYYDLLFIKHDTKDNRWYDPGQDGDITQPKLGPYLYGFSLHLSGVTDIDTTLNKIRFNSATINSKPWWIALWSNKVQNIPSYLQPCIELLWTARKTALIFAVCALATLMLICTTVSGNSLFGFLTAALLMINRLFAPEARHATTDTMQLFFFFFNILLIQRWIIAYFRKQNRGTLVLSILLGINSGLGMSTKTSGLMINMFLFVFLGCIFVYEVSLRRSVLTLILNGIIIGIFSIGLFYIFHPIVYKDTGRALWAIFYSRTREYEQYWSSYPGSAVNSRSKAITLIVQKTLSPNAPYGNFPFTPIPLDGVLFMVGIAFFVFHFLQKPYAAQRIFHYSIIPLWTLTTFVCLVFYLSNDWSRYYLPLEANITLVQGYGVYCLIKLFRSSVLSKYLNKSSVK